MCHDLLVVSLVLGFGLSRFLSLITEAEPSTPVIDLLVLVPVVYFPIKSES